VKKFRERNKLKRNETDDNDDNETDNVVEEKRIEKKRKEDIVLPDWINLNAWNAWVQHRKEIKKPLKPTTIRLQLRFLEEHKKDHTQIIKNSIVNGWTGLFVLRVDSGPPNRRLDYSRAHEKRIQDEEETQYRIQNAEENERRNLLKDQVNSLTTKFKT
jgi:hypothetical protein